MYLDDPINKALRTLVRTALNLPADSVRPANLTNAPAGGQGDPFATVYISSAIPTGRDQRLEKNDPDIALNLLETIVGMYHVVASVQFFREGAVTLARALKGAIETSDGIAYMQSQNIGFIRCGPALNLTDVVDTFYEERAKVELEVFITLMRSSSLPTFGTFPITIAVENNSSTFTVSEP